MVTVTGEFAGRIAKVARLLEEDELRKTRSRTRRRAG